MREFAVTFVGDDELDGKDWAIVTVGRTVILAVKRSRVCPGVIAEAWAAFRRAEGETDARPFQRTG